MEHTGLATFLEWFLPVSLRHCFLATYFSYYIKSATTRSIISPIYYILPFFLELNFMHHQLAVLKNQGLKYSRNYGNRSTARQMSFIQRYGKYVTVIPKFTWLLWQPKNHVNQNLHYTSHSIDKKYPKNV